MMSTNLILFLITGGIIAIFFLIIILILYYFTLKSDAETEEIRLMFENWKEPEEEKEENELKNDTLEVNTL